MITLRPLELGEIIPSKNYKAIITHTGQYLKEYGITAYQEVFIDTPPQPERDWTLATYEIMKLAMKMSNGFINDGMKKFGDEVIKILQQADKPAPVKMTTKRWVNIYNMDYDDREHKSRWDADNCAKSLDRCGVKRIACKEIEIEYYENEGLDG